LITGNWVAEVPIGRGKALLGDTRQSLNQLIGGWKFAGVARWTSGLPFSVISGTGWSTNWDEQSSIIQTGPIRTHTHIANGTAQVFADPSHVLDHLRNPYPGEAGQRNNFRGDGYFSLDSSLIKNWRIDQQSTLTLSWEVFNVSNSVRFDVNPLTSLQNTTTSGELGVYDATLTKPRVQQFSLRYMF
jgi:hypothetical protein